MYNNFNMKQHTQESFEDSLSRDERRNAHQLMVEQFYNILMKSHDVKIIWKGSKTDLMELTYEMFMSGTMRDSCGRPCSFISIVNTVCANLHVTPPANPYSIISKARLRKGIRQHSFFSRYCWLLINRHKRNPLHIMMERVV